MDSLSSGRTWSTPCASNFFITYWPLRITLPTVCTIRYCIISAVLWWKYRLQTLTVLVVFEELEISQGIFLLNQKLIGSGPGFCCFFLGIRNTDLNSRVRWRWVRAAAIFAQISHPRSYPYSGRFLSWVYFLPVLRIHDILVWVRIRGSMLLTNGSGSCYFHQWPSRR